MSEKTVQDDIAAETLRLEDAHEGRPLDVPLTSNPQPSDSDAERSVSPDLPQSELSDLISLIDSLAVLRLKSQSEEQLRVLIVAKIIGEISEPPGEASCKSQILQSLSALSKSDSRVAVAARSALEQVGKQWSSATLSMLNFDLAACLPPRPRSSRRLSPFRSLHKQPRQVEDSDMTVFGFLGRPVFEQLSGAQGGSRPLEAVMELEAAFKAVELDTVRGHFGDILELLVAIAGDKNVKTRTVALGMLHSVLSVKGVSLQVDLLPYVDKLLPKLGDMNIHVRQSVFRCLRAVLRECRLSKLLPSFTQSLSAANWHQREEVLKLFITAMLAVDEAHNIDFLELVQVVTPLMDDETPKVRYVAVETLCVLAHICGVERVDREIRPMMDELALALLKGRFAKKSLPVVREDTVDFPRDAPLSAPVSTKSLHHAVSGPKTPSSTFSFSGLESTSTAERSLALPSEASAIPTETKSLQPTARVRNRSLESPLPRVKEVKVMIGSSSATDLRSDKRRSGRLRATLATLKPELTFPRNSSLPTLPSLPRNSSLSTLQREPEAGPSVLSASASLLTYLKPEEIEAPENTSRDLDRVLQGLQAIEWAEQFETLNLIRKLLKFSPESLKTGSFAEVLRQVLIWAESLRSSLSKNALIVLGEMCEFLPRSLESDLDQLLSLLLRKSVDTNLFISEVAQRALQQMCTSISDGRLVTCLLSNIGAIRSSLVKAKTAYCFELLIARLRGQFPKIRDFARVMKSLFDYSQDASAEVRHAAKRAFRRLAKETPQDDIDRYMSRILPSKAYSDYLDGQKTWGEAEEPPRPLQQGSAREFVRREGGPVRRLVIRSSRAIEKAGQEAEQMQEVTAGMRGLVWKERYDAVTKAAELALQSGASHLRSASLSTALDSLSTGITDTSIKVSFHSINCLKKLLNPLQAQISSHLPSLVLALSHVLSSSNSSLKNLAIEVLAKLIGHAEVPQSLPSLAAAFSNVTGKGKIGVLKLISELIPASPSKELILKHAVPIAKGLLGDGIAPELQSEAKEFVQRLDGLIKLDGVLTEEELARVREWRGPNAAYS